MGAGSSPPGGVPIAESPAGLSAGSSTGQASGKVSCGRRCSAGANRRDAGQHTGHAGGNGLTAGLTNSGVAQVFTTGDNAAGYELASVKVIFHSAGGGRPSTQDNHRAPVRHRHTGGHALRTDRYYVVLRRYGDPQCAERSDAAGKRTLLCGFRGNRGPHRVGH